MCFFFNNSAYIYFLDDTQNKYKPENKNHTGPLKEIKQNGKSQVKTWDNLLDGMKHN